MSQAIANPHRHSETYNFDPRVVDVFAPDILDTVGAVAEELNSFSYEQLMARIPDVKTYPSTGNKPISVLDITPAEYDRVMAIHPPMGGSLNEDRMVRAATVAAALPHTRVITVSNPGELGSRGGELSYRNLKKVASGDFRPAVDATMRYLESQNIEAVDHVGASYGADKAATAASIADKYDQKVNHLVTIDPVSLEKRTIKGLTKEFGTTQVPVAEYVTRTGNEGYVTARRHSSSLFRHRNITTENENYLKLKLGFLRPSNVAASIGLTHPLHEDLLTKALQRQPEMHAGVIWAGESELCKSGLIRAIVAREQERYPGRVSGIELPGQRHVMTSDIYLNAAMIMMGLRDQTTKP